MVMRYWLRMTRFEACPHTDAAAKRFRSGAVLLLG